MRFKTGSADETQELARKVLSEINEVNVICLYGELGAGKTTLVQGLGSAMGIQGKMISPTYVLIRQYPLNQSVKKDVNMMFHVDLYRLNGPKEINDLALSDLWSDKQNLMLIEWPERLGGQLPIPRVDIRINHIGENDREIIIEKITK